MGGESDSHRGRGEAHAPISPLSNPLGEGGPLLQRLAAIGIDQLSPPLTDPIDDTRVVGNASRRGANERTSRPRGERDSVERPKHAAGGNVDQSEGEAHLGETPSRGQAETGFVPGVGSVSKSKNQMGSLNQHLKGNTRALLKREDSGKSLEDFIAENILPLQVIVSSSSEQNTNSSPSSGTDSSGDKKASVSVLDTKFTDPVGLKDDDSISPLDRNKTELPYPMKSVASSVRRASVASSSMPSLSDNSSNSGESVADSSSDVVSISLRSPNVQKLQTITPQVKARFELDERDDLYLSGTSESFNSVSSSSQGNEESQGQVVKRRPRSSSPRIKPGMEKANTRRKYSVSPSSRTSAISKSEGKETVSSPPFTSRKKVSQSLTVSPARSRQSARSNSSPASSRHSIGSQTSLLGQQFLILQKSEGSMDVSFADEGSLAYSENSSPIHPLGPLGTIQHHVVSMVPSKSTKPRAVRRRNSLGASSESSCSTLSSKSHSRHTGKKPRRGSYDGAMLQLVESLHGSGSSTENFLGSMSDIFANYLSGTAQTPGSPHSGRVGKPTAPASPSLRSKSSPSEKSRKVATPQPASKGMGSTGMTVGKQRDSNTGKGDSRSPRSHGDQKHPGSISAKKSPRRRSMNSVSSSSDSSSGEKHPRRPPQKQPRRHSLGSASPLPAHNIPEDVTPLIEGAAFGSVSQRVSKSPKPALSNFIGEHYKEDDNTGYFSAASSNGPFSSSSSVSTTSIDRSPKEVSRKVVAASNPKLVIPRAPKSASPIRRPKVILSDDFNKMSSSAPARLIRVRSPRRRRLLLAQMTDGETANVVEKLSIGTLDDKSNSRTSLPPRSPSTSRRKLVEGTAARDRINSRAKTIRTSNRTVDIMPEIAELKRGRRHSFSAGDSIRIDRGLSAIIRDSEDDSSVSSGSSSDSSEADPRVRSSLLSSTSWATDSLGRCSWHSETKGVAEGAGLPPRPRASNKRSQSIRSESSMSSLSNAGSASSHSSSSSGTEIVELKIVTRHESFTSRTMTSESTYDLKAYNLAIPDSSDASMHLSVDTNEDTSSEHIVRPAFWHLSSSKSSTSSDTDSYRLEPVPWSIPESSIRELSLRSNMESSESVEEASVPEDDSSYPVLPVSRIDSRASTQSAWSEITYDTSGFSQRQIHGDEMGNISRRDEQQVGSESINVTPVTPNPIQPAVVEEMEEEHRHVRSRNPIWKKLEEEKRRQDRLRAKLNAPTGSN